MKNIVVYNTGELEVNVSIEEETLWLNQKQLEKIPTIRKIRIVQQEGNK